MKLYRIGVGGIVKGLDYRDKGNSKWSLGSNPESLKGRATLHLEDTKNLRPLFYLIKSNLYACLDVDFSYCVHFLITEVIVV